MESHELKVFADYHQFYVWDAGTNPEAPEDWTDGDVARRVIVRSHVVVVQPERNMTVPVRIEIHAADPGFNPGGWDHIAQCSLDLPTGHLQVHECTGGALLDRTLAPGTYRMRVLFAGLGTLSSDGLEGEDRYVVALWPGPAQPFLVVQQYPAR